VQIILAKKMKEYHILINIKLHLPEK